MLLQKHHSNIKLETSLLLPLSACPIGLFNFKGKLCFKTGNSTEDKCDVFVVDTGKVFTGGLDGDDEIMRAMVRSVRIAE